MSETLDYLKTFAAFPLAARRQEAPREAAFLQSVERSIYGLSRSFYLRLLRHADCEPGDVQALVKREDGVDCLLDALGRS